MNKCYKCNRRVYVNKKGENKGVCKDCIRLKELAFKKSKIINDVLTPVIVEIHNLTQKVYKNTL